MEETDREKRDQLEHARRQATVAEANITNLLSKLDHEQQNLLEAVCKFNVLARETGISEYMDIAYDSLNNWKLITHQMIPTRRQ